MASTQYSKLYNRANNVSLDIRELYQELVKAEKRIFDLELELHQKNLEAENMGRIIEDQQAKLDAPKKTGE